MRCITLSRTRLEASIIGISLEQVQGKPRFENKEGRCRISAS